MTKPEPSLIKNLTYRKGPIWEIAFIRPGREHRNQILPADGCARGQGAMDFMPSRSSTPSAAKAKLSTESQRDFAATESPLSAVSQAHGEEEQLSLDPNVRIKVEKLEMALNYLGIHPNEEQKRLMKQDLKMDANGTVEYGDFVQVARKLFTLQIKEGDFGQGMALSGGQEITNLLDPNVSKDPLCDLSVSDDPEQLRRERNEAYAELRKLKERLQESEKNRSQLSEELEKVKQEAKGAVEETRALRNRIHLAEVAQSQASGMETDYEEVIRLLEAEVTELKAQLSKRSGQTKGNVQDLKGRASVLGCQLRKSEMARKAFEVTTEKLQQFAENVCDILSDDSANMLNLSEKGSPFSSKTLMSRLKPCRHDVIAAMAAEARDLAISVRSMVDTQCLPYGLEEAYTADGIKYYINHVTQTTTWTNPVLSTLLSGELEDTQRDPPEQQNC
ncbi:syntaxin-binding protein 4 isoform X2 [Xenopus laevis]|uniref:Syntaxin-binding protein 4 isoform X2 n=1 Tax=Xenopus laevis TaxID=8355 RepID=A0A8J0TVV4_XENLA|nr:syntaxin-binding protein 4 isoform X2 [Xenopus laevis]